MSKNLKRVRISSDLDYSPEKQHSKKALKDSHSLEKKRKRDKKAGKKLKHKESRPQSGICSQGLEDFGFKDDIYETL